MPILTKAAAPVKGTATLFTLDKAALAAVTSVAADAYFSIQAKWKSIDLVYHSSVGNQNQIVKFNASQSSPTSDFLVSNRARDIFEIQKIVIKDFDGGTFEVLRSELTTAEFDIDFSVVAPFYLRDFASPNSQQPFETLVYGSISGNVLNCYKAPYSTVFTSSQVVDLELGATYKVRLYVNNMSSHPDYSGLSDDFRFGISLEIGANGNPSQVVVISGSQMRSAIGSFYEATFTASSLNIPSSIKMLTQIYFAAEYFSLNKIEITKV